MGSSRKQDGRAGQQALLRLVQARDQARVDDGAAPALPRPQPVTLKRAALAALARAFDRLYQLPSQTLDLSPLAITLAEMAELLPRPALFSLVEGEGDAIGVVAICPSLMTALIEMQTLGRITTRPVDARKPTRSDAIICADFVNTLLDELAEDVPRIDGFQDFAGFRYASYLDDHRPLMLMLEDCPYRVLSYRLRLGGEPAREGVVFVALPQPALAALPPPTAERATAGGRAAPGRHEGGGRQPENMIALDGVLAEPMKQAPVDVVGVLCRRAMRLGDLRALTPGQILPLPRVDLSQTRLETRHGQLLAIGKLGEADGYHAIRLHAAGASDATPFAGSREAAAFADRTAGQQAETPVENDRNRTAEPPIADLSQPDSFRMTGDPVSGDQGPAGRPAARPRTTASQQKTAITG